MNLYPRTEQSDAKKIKSPSPIPSFDLIDLKMKFNNHNEEYPKHIPKKESVIVISLPINASANPKIIIRMLIFVESKRNL